MIRTAKGPLVTLPYTVELNDIPMMIVQHHESDHLLKRAHRQFRPAVSGRRGSARRSVAGDPSLHFSGQPFRIKYLEQIYDYVNKLDGVRALER